MWRTPCHIYRGGTDSYTKQHKYYSNIDVHTRVMCVRVLNAGGEAAVRLDVPLSRTTLRLPVDHRGHDRRWAAFTRRSN